MNEDWWGPVVSSHFMYYRMKIADIQIPRIELSCISWLDVCPGLMISRTRPPATMDSTKKESGESAGNRLANLSGYGNIVIRRGYISIPTGVSQNV